jgi:hypothetical protein
MVKIDESKTKRVRNIRTGLMERDELFTDDGRWALKHEENTTSTWTVIHLRTDRYYSFIRTEKEALRLINNGFILDYWARAAKREAAQPI